MRRYWWGILLAFLMIVLVIFLIVSSMVDNTQKNTVVKIIPSEAVATIENKGYHNGNYYISPGLYTVTLHNDGFTDKIFEINIEDGEENIISGYLLEEDGGWDYYYKNEDELEGLREYFYDSSEEVKSFIDKYDKELKKSYDIKEEKVKTSIGIDANLLIKKDKYAIYIYYTENHSDCNSDSKRICLLINDPTGSGSDSVKDLMKKDGYNPDVVQLIYKDTSKRS